MKKSILYKIVVGTLALFMCSACGDDFLESENAGLLSRDEFYKTDEDSFQATMAVYDILQWDYSNGWASPYMLKTMPSDESNAAGSGESDQPAYQALDRFTYDPTNSVVLGTWRVNYYGIARANQVINYVSPETDARVINIAESKALRGYYYFQLVTLFGDVPLVLTELTEEEYDQERVATDKVYEQIEADLLDAIEDLPLKSAYSEADKFRVSKGTAQALLGKVYLFEEKYEQAAAMFDAVIQSNEYGLMSSYGAIFTTSAELGIESIFEVMFASTQSYNWDNYPWDTPREMESNIHVELMGPRGDYYSQADSLIAGWGFNLPKEEMYQAFINAGDSIRRINTLMTEEELEANGGEWTNPDAYGYEGYIRRKYGTFSTETDMSGVADLNYGTNFRLIRYADVLLMAAEAYYKDGNESRARTELNKVRERAMLDDVTASGDDLWDAIVLERQLELAFEGFRFVDLVRWGMADEVLADYGFVKGKHELFPIPDIELQVDAKLTQNPNY